MIFQNINAPPVQVKDVTFNGRVYVFNAIFIVFQNTNASPVLVSTQALRPAWHVKVPGSSAALTTLTVCIRLTHWLLYPLWVKGKMVVLNSSRFYPYLSRLLHWHRGDLTVAPLPVKITPNMIRERTGESPRRSCCCRKRIKHIKCVYSKGQILYVWKCV